MMTAGASVATAEGQLVDHSLLGADWVQEQMVGQHALKAAGLFGLAAAVSCWKAARL